MYTFENDEIDCILYCTCTVLCYILEYIYIGQIANRFTSPVFAFNMQNATKHSDLVKCLVVHVESTIYNAKQYMFKTKYALLYHSRTYTKIYIGIDRKYMNRVFQKTCNNFLPLLKLGLSRDS